MHLDDFFVLPLQNPTLIFAVVLLVILCFSLISNKLKIPSLVGLIIAGFCLGPGGLNVLQDDKSFDLFGNVGLLYIVFIAGAQIDINDLRRHRWSGSLFGILSFFTTMALGVIVGTKMLHLSFAVATLISLMFSSHTIITYPILNKYGLTISRPVKIAAVSSVLTIVFAFTILTFITGQYTIWTQMFWLEWSLKLLGFILVVLWLMPKIAHSFFKHFEDNILQYIFVLSLLFMAAFFAQMAGLEGVLGAFLIGVALNRLIPNVSPLMNRLEFVGNSLFIPFFLIAIGMMVHVNTRNGLYEFLSSIGGWTLVAMIVVPIISKSCVAIIAPKIFRMKREERGLFFGLSSGQAAITLAVIMVGYSKQLPVQLLPANLIPAAVIMLIVISMISSFATEQAARRIVARGDSSAASNRMPRRRQRILLAVSHPQTIEAIVQMALWLKNQNSKDALYALNVLTNSDDELKQQSNLLLEQVAKMAMTEGQWVERVSRHDFNEAIGVRNAARELNISDILLGVNPANEQKGVLFGSTTRELLREIHHSLYILRASTLTRPNNVTLILPENIEAERDFPYVLNSVRQMVKNTGASLTIYCTSPTRITLVRMLRMTRASMLTNYNLYANNAVASLALLPIETTDLLVIVRSRSAPALTYEEGYESIMEELIVNNPALPVLMIYPANKEDQSDDLISRLLHAYTRADTTLQWLKARWEKYVLKQKKR